MAHSTFITLFTIFAMSPVSLASSLGSKCLPGTYSQSGGNSPCYECPAGSFSKDNGARECIPARAGYYVPTSGLTTEYSCPAGSYSGASGSTSCSPCPPGHMCPSGALEKPQPCSPGRYSVGGNVVSCTLCAAGSFNNVHAATGCCACCAGHFNGHPGNTNCQACPNQQPYSDPGTTSQGGCSSKKGYYVPEPTCVQKPNADSCPTAQAFPSHVSKRDVRRRRCLRPGQKACPLYSAATRRSPSVLTGYDCVDIENDLESCGGCVDRSLDGERSSDGGRDCSAIPNIDAVRCERRKCVIDSCRPGFTKSIDGEDCIPIPVLRKQQ